MIIRLRRARGTKKNAISASAGAVMGSVLSSKAMGPFEMVSVAVAGELPGVTEAGLNVAV
jgi:hypothetical protein